MMPHLKLLEASKSDEFHLFFYGFCVQDIVRFLAAEEDGLRGAKMLKTYWFNCVCPTH